MRSVWLTIDDNIPCIQQRQQLLQHPIHRLPMRQTQDEHPRPVLGDVKGVDHVFEGGGADQVDVDVGGVLDGFVEHVIGLREKHEMLRDKPKLAGG